MIRGGVQEGKAGEVANLPGESASELIAVEVPYVHKLASLLRVRVRLWVRGRFGFMGEAEGNCVQLVEEGHVTN